MPIFRDVFRREPEWATLTPRLVPSKLFPDDPAILARILAEAPKRPKPAGQLKPHKGSGCPVRAPASAGHSLAPG